MSTRTLPLDDQLHRYLQGVSVREPHIFERCRLETAELPMCSMQISPEQGQFMNLLLRMIGAQNAIELGSFTGYSGLWLASALPDKGCLVACDINEEWVCQARRYWQQAGLMNRIEIRLGHASDTLVDLAEIRLVALIKGGFGVRLFGGVILRFSRSALEVRHLFVCNNSVAVIGKCFIPRGMIAVVMCIKEHFFGSAAKPANSA